MNEVGCFLSKDLKSLLRPPRNLLVTFDQLEKLGLRKSDTVANAEFLEKVFGDSHAGLQRECVLGIQLLCGNDLVEILPAAMHQLFEAVTLLAEPVRDNRFLTHGQILVIDHLAEGICPLLENGQVDPSQENADHRTPKRTTKEVTFPSELTPIL